MTVPYTFDIYIYIYMYIYIYIYICVAIFCYAFLCFVHPGGPVNTDSHECNVLLTRLGHVWDIVVGTLLGHVVETCGTCLEYMWVCFGIGLEHGSASFGTLFSLFWNM